MNGAALPMSDLFNRLWSTLLRVALAVFGVLMFFGVMAVGALLAFVLIVWALLRGRSAAPIKFRWGGPVDWRRSGRNANPGTASAAADVVDIEVREVDAPVLPAEPPPRPPPQPPRSRLPD